MKDTHKLRGLRQRLVKYLQSRGIDDSRILDAFMDIPRHYFISKDFAEWAYRDEAFLIAAGQTISHPYTVAFQTDLLQIKSSDKILEIGTGSGYQAAVIASMGAKLYTIERQAELYHTTNKLLIKLGYDRIRTLFGDGYQGAPRFAPFDKIIVTCGASFIPKALPYQLKIGGRMVIPVGEGEDKMMTVITRESETEFSSEKKGIFKFVPFLEGTNEQMQSAISKPVIRVKL
ncbi:MAG: protein-L-isoaspartate(D-aspartate) O-methyltransferase [Saprospiraceae bacterium]|nr:protein-L-isoaspartate(D-aspartate) O-methyltransferase [Saprospiraceae bacterium]